MIQEKFLESLSKYASDPALVQQLWDEIANAYSKRERHYHTLHHLDTLVYQLQDFRNSFASWDAIIFAIAYHDLVYNTLKSNNEERSAEIAVTKLKAIQFPPDQIEMCEQLILATKKHLPGDRETNLFTDADLSILGADRETYMQYAMQIRKEYSIFPDLVYKPGRKKVLMHFLQMNAIFKTPEFAFRYEVSTRENLKWELDGLMRG